MTREAIEYFKFHRKILCKDHLKICPKNSIAYQATLKEKEFYDMAIKALKQESILDKLRAEIESITPKAHIRTGKLSIETELMVPLDRVLKVIDKYTAESDDK